MVSGALSPRRGPIAAPARAQDDAPRRRPASRASGPAVAFLVAFAVSILSAGCEEAREELDDPELEGRAANPDGVPYPTDNLGGVEHSRARSGDRIPNFTFLAYEGGDRSGGLKPVSLADYYDPDQKRHRLLHLKVSATWCGYCSAALVDLVRSKQELEAEGAVSLEVVVSGPTNRIGPSLGELDGWVERHGSNVTTAVDVRARRLGGIGVDGTVVPWDLLIDTRTMEILDSSGGAPSDVKRYVRDGLAFVANNPPGY